MKEQKDASDTAAIAWLAKLEQLVKDAQDIQAEPVRLGLTEPGEHALFTVIRSFTQTKDEGLCVRAAKHMVAVLRKKGLLPQGWGDHKAGRQRVSMTLQVESWEPDFEPLGLAQPDQQKRATQFLTAAVDELARALEAA
jgi:hypothetical protein